MAEFQLEKTMPAFAESHDGTRPSDRDLEIVQEIIETHQNETDRRRSAPSKDRLHDIQDARGFWIALVNATPYRWKLVEAETHGMEFTYNEGFVEYVEPGESLTIYAQPEFDDAMALVRYEILGTVEPSWFTLNLSPHYPHTVKIGYGGGLKTIVQRGPTGTKTVGAGHMLDLLVDRGVPCATFYLAGREDRFYANNAPFNWMNAILPDIGNFTLRDIMLPRSHHSLMWKVFKKFGFANRASTITQTHDLYDQMRMGGVRVIDFRPMLTKDGEMVESHGSKLAGVYHGALGARIDDLIEQLNRFNKDYPGELTIIDIDHEEMREEAMNFIDMRSRAVEDLVMRLAYVDHRVNVTNGEDVTKLPISTFIGEGQSAVIIRINANRVRHLPKMGFPGSEFGFVTSDDFPMEKRWTDSGDGTTMVVEQIRELEQHRKNGNEDPLYTSDFVITQKGWNIVHQFPVTRLNGPAWILMASSLWPALRGTIYPNWLSMDAISGTELKGFALAVNQCFVAKRCGRFQGRIPDAPSIPTKVTRHNNPDEFKVVEPGYSGDGIPDPKAPKPTRKPIDLDKFNSLPADVRSHLLAKPTGIFQTHSAIFQ